MLKDVKGNEIPFKNVDEALLMLKMSSFAGLNVSQLHTELQEHLDPLGWTKVKVIYNSSTSTQGFIARQNTTGSLVVSFGATLSAEDWLTNLNIRPKDLGNNVQVHTGFYNVVESVYAMVAEELLENIMAGRRIYITGISLGGALSSMFTFRFANDYKQYNDQTWLFMYGAPPVGNVGFVCGLHNLVSKAFDINLIGDKVSYERCLIPIFLSMPPRIYLKTGTVYYLPKKGGHNFRQYDMQLNSIQTWEGYTTEYGLEGERYIEELMEIYEERFEKDKKEGGDSKRIKMEEKLLKLLNEQ